MHGCQRTPGVFVLIVEYKRAFGSCKRTEVPPKGTNSGNPCECMTRSLNKGKSAWPLSLFLQSICVS